MIYGGCLNASNHWNILQPYDIHNEGIENINPNVYVILILEIYVP